MKKGEVTPLLITGGLICDGTGNTPPYEGDVILSHGKIERILPRGKRSSASFPSCRTIDAKGLLLAPGFIDMHSHSDLSLFAAPEAPGLLAQGVTSIVTGNCGLSPFPILTEEVREHLGEIYKRYGERLSWSTFREYAFALEKRAPAVNVTALAGHNTLRANFSSYGQKESTPEMTSAMKNALRATLAEGAAGLSTGLLYVPGKHASQAELLGLMEILKEFDALYATHLRSEGAFLKEALEEALLLGSAASGRIQISHLKTAGKKNWHLLDGILARFREARKKGLRLFADRYPYTFAQSSLSLVLPGKYEEMSDKAIQEELNLLSGDVLMALARETRESRKDWDRVILTSTGSPFALKYSLPGKNLREASAVTGMGEGELILKILREDSPGSMAAFGGMSEENLRSILREDFVACGTDETSRSLNHSLGKSHPRGFGSFPGFAGILAEEGLPLEKIIYRLTGLPAKILKWENRGVIREGAYADIVLLDWKNFRPCATFAEPHKPASGVEKVFVNGVEREEKRNGVILSPSGGKLF